MNAKEIVLTWKLEIESINIRGYSRKVTDIDCFKMNKYYTGEGVLTDCFKVNFGFEDGFTQNPCNEIHLNQDERDEWNKTLEEHFISKFGKVIDNTEYGDLLFHNEICDYMVNQGHRFIIQFYLPGVISKLREEKLNQLIN
jgi:hypothetical protein